MMQQAIYEQMGNQWASRVRPRDDFVKPFSKPETTPWCIALVPNSLQKLILGFESGSMDDKWIIFSTGPDSKGNLTIHMHRSWTGYKIIELNVQVPTIKTNHKRTAYITAITWETDEKFFYSEGEVEVKETARKLCEYILGFELGPEETQMKSVL